ncbi:MAG: phosphatase PAP2 family protein [Phycisphaerales bacterium]|nr:phosphatase PAP2 family protein [Phycisphaerales bacterium]
MPQYSGYGGPKFRDMTRGMLWWAVLFIIACGWDRAFWLMTISSGEPLLAGVRRAGDFTGLQEGLDGTLALKLESILSLLIGLVYDLVYLFGRIWIWIAIAVVLIFRGWITTDTARVGRGLREGVFVVFVPTVAGLAAEAMKLITGRLRPEAADGFYAFHWSWSASGKGLASSHAAVAIAAALAAGLLFPRWRMLLWPLAVACVLSRVLVGAHFVSDVVAGTALGLLAFRLVYAWDARNNSGLPIDADRSLRDLTAS